MQTKGTRELLAHDAQALAEVEQLLEQYPEVSEEERGRVGRFLRSGAPIDIGLLSSNPRLWNKAEGFRAENKQYFSTARGVYIGWAAAILGIFMVLLLMKDIGLN